MNCSLLHVQPKLNKSLKDVSGTAGLGFQILELCNGHRSTKDILSEFFRKYPNCDKEILATETLNALFEFKKRGILAF